MRDVGWLKREIVRSVAGKAVRREETGFEVQDKVQSVKPKDDKTPLQSLLLTAFPSSRLLWKGCWCALSPRKCLQNISFDICYPYVSRLVARQDLIAPVAPRNTP